MKKFNLAVILVATFLVLALSGCANSLQDSTESPVAAATVDVTGISVDKESIDVVVGDAGTILVTYLPADATTKIATFVSSDITVVTVDKFAGTYKVIKAGTAKIAITSADGGFKKTVAINATAAATTTPTTPAATTPTATTPTTTPPVVTPTVSADVILTFDGATFVGKTFLYDLNASGGYVLKDGVRDSFSGIESYNFSSHKDELVIFNVRKGGANYFVEADSTSASGYKITLCTAKNETNYAVWKDGKLMIWAQ